MMHTIQIREFYDSLSEEEQKDLCEAIAEDIYFLEEKMQKAVLESLEKAHPDMSDKIRRINGFTI
ncbi:MAG: catalase-related domain-containing protein [Anaerovoracaceae bacterium]|nr:catalase-related domain-containing protein [Anaerovoracaceae bacterium]